MLKQKPQLIMEDVVYKKLQQLTNERPIEWSLFGKTRQEGYSTFYLEELIVPIQINSGHDTEIPQNVEFEGKKVDAMFEWQVRDRNMEDPKTWRSPSEWNLLIHSHHSMGVFWSKTDEEEMENMAKERKTPCLSLVLSSKNNGEVKLRIMYPQEGIYFEDCDILLQDPLPSLEEYIKKPQEEQERIKNKMNQLELIDIDKYEVKQKQPIGFSYNNLYKKEKGEKIAVDTIDKENSYFQLFEEAIKLQGEGLYMYDFNEGKVIKKITKEQAKSQYKHLIKKEIIILELSEEKWINEKYINISAFYPELIEKIPDLILNLSFECTNYDNSDFYAPNYGTKQQSMSWDAEDWDRHWR